MTHDEQEAQHRAEARAHMGDPAHPERRRAWSDFKVDANSERGIVGYQAINDHLYAGGALTEDDYVRHESFSLFHTTQDERLFRGQNARSEYAFRRLDGRMPGDMHRDPAYVSTSYTRAKAEWFLHYSPDDAPIYGRYLYEIAAPPGVAYAPIDPNPNWTFHPGTGEPLPNEDELVLPPGTSLYQTEPLHIDDNGITVYTVVPLPPEAPAPPIGLDVRNYSINAWARWNQSRRGPAS